MPVPPGGDAVQPLHPDHRGSISSHTPCFRKYLLVFALLGDRFRARHGEPHLPDAAGAEPPQQRPGKVQVLRRRSRKKKKRIRVERIRGFPPRPIMIVLHDDTVFPLQHSIALSSIMPCIQLYYTIRTYVGKYTGILGTKISTDTWKTICAPL